MSSPEEYNSPLIAEMARVTPQERDKVWLKMQIAVRIADLLDEKRLSQKELAQVCGLKDPSVVTKWLSGGYNFSVDTLVDISHALDVSVADLVRPEEE